MSTRVALGRYFSLKSFSRLVYAVAAGAAILVMPWTRYVQQVQTCLAIAAYSIGILTACHLLGPATVFERCLPISVRQRRLMNWLISAALTLAGTVPLFILYCSTASHGIDPIAVPLMCLLLGCGCLCRIVFSLLGRRPSIPMILLLPLVLFLSGQILSSEYLRTYGSRESFGRMLLASVFTLLLEGVITICWGDRETGSAGGSAHAPKRVLRPHVPTSPVILPSTLPSPQPTRSSTWLIHGKMLAMGLVNQPGYLGWAMFMSFIIFYNGVGNGSIWIMVLPLGWGGRELILSVTRSLCRNGVIDRRIAFVTALSPLVLFLLLSAYGSTWIWAPSYQAPFEKFISIPSKDDVEGIGQTVVLDQSVSPLRSVRLPDGMVMSLSDFGRRLQLHHVMPSTDFLATQLALTVARDEGISPDPRRLIQVELGEVSTKPILAEIVGARRHLLFLTLEILLVGLMFTFALMRTQGPRPFRGLVRSYLDWEIAVPIGLFLLLFIWLMLPLALDHIPQRLSQDLAYPHVELTWFERMRVLLLSHVWLVGTLLAMVGVVSSVVAITRIRQLELDPLRSGDFLARMREQSKGTSTPA